MDQYEYKIFSGTEDMDIEKDMDLLDAAGKDGWELVTLIPMLGERKSGHGMREGVFYFLKKKIEESEED